ncbi:hypothetical protein THASP1DRAFT_31791 [Thamnocephalis sphaerospora]|uniref:DNA repair protein REV1 n=1 Tax=Thamnocephalis sphaerospora TaxID=78915 RepID=A0A4P9XM09_9FUNG|nr:hypothetical protein THASP1DRAFT_31791 [Thamnocephalis sphaerospora]|eukprot:RKP06391.1 hypothetical protein THASP1DRAFT_31791 [Thamnocephalis sphaerospora]
MVSKQRKLEVQQQDLLSLSKGATGECLSQLFAGVSIYITGYTRPSLAKLRELICLHGGRFVQYYSRALVTHIIATALTPAKFKQWQSEKIVLPDWITESIAAGRLLRWTNFRLDNERAFQAEKAFWQQQTCLVQSLAQHEARTLTENTSMVAAVTDTCTDKTVMPKMSKSAALGKSQEQHLSPALITGSPEQIYKVTDVDRPEIRTYQSLEPAMSTETATSARSLSQDTCFDALSDGISNSQLAAFADMTTSDVVTDDRISNLAMRTGAIGEAGWIRQQQHKDLPTRLAKVQLEVPGSPGSKDIRSGRQHAVSSADAPDFVSRYYAASRLHHLSSWKIELRKIYNELSIRNTPIDVRKRIVMHIDMDCFFTSVAVRDRPELERRPVGVSHATCTKSASDLASCNYKARRFGVKNGMRVKDARKLCPDLVVLPYNFAAYRAVSAAFYQASGCFIIAQHALQLQAVSCDEALIAFPLNHFLPGDSTQKALDLAAEIRRQISEATYCTASVGVSRNILLARLATKYAKPDGQYYLHPAQAASTISDLPVKTLPGVGWSMRTKLNEKGILVCGDIRKHSSRTLQGWFGATTGTMLYNYCRGVDDRPLQVEVKRQSIGTNISWGVRFDCAEQVQRFVGELAAEVARRAAAEDVKGKLISFKLYKRHVDAAPEHSMYKPLGHGKCDILNRTTRLTTATRSATVLAEVCMTMLRDMAVTVGDIRGMGIQLQRLSGTSPCNGTAQKSILAYAKSTLGVPATQGPTFKRTPKDPIAADLNVFKGLSESAQKEVQRTPPHPVTLDPDQAKEVEVCDTDALSWSPSPGSRQLSTDVFTVQPHPLIETGASLDTPSPRERHLAFEHSYGNNQPAEKDALLANCDAVTIEELTLSQLDDAVFEALPEHIRAEIVEDIMTTTKRRAEAQEAQTIAEPSDTPSAAAETLTQIWRTYDRDIPPTNVDRDVFAALPADIRDELITRRSIQKRRLPPLKPRFHALQPRAHDERHPSVAPRMVVQTQSAPPLISGLSALDDVRQLIDSLLEQETSGESFDLLRVYITGLVEAKDLERVSLVLRRIERPSTANPIGWRCASRRLRKHATDLRRVNLFCIAMTTPTTEQRLAGYAYGLDPLFWQDVKLFCAHLRELSPHDSIPEIYFLNGLHPVRTVCLVGLIVAIERSGQNAMLYTLDDGTGLAVCTLWDTDQIERSADRQVPVLGDLVHIRGRVREFREKRQVQIYRLELVRDPNAETLHWLEVVQLEKRMYTHAPSVPKEILSRRLAIERHMWSHVVNSGGDDYNDEYAKFGTSPGVSLSDADDGAHYGNAKSMEPRVFAHWDPWSEAEETATEEAFRIVMQRCIDVHMQSAEATGKPCVISFRELQQDTRLSALAERVIARRQASADTRPVQSDNLQPQMNALFKQAIGALLHSGHVYLADPVHDTYGHVHLRGNLAAALLEPLRDATSRLSMSQVGVRLDYLVAKIRAKDDRFQQVDRFAVQAALQHLERQGEAYETAPGLFKAV